MLLAGAVVVGGATSVMAQTSSSANYQATETQFSSGATLESCSVQYCAKATIGDMAAGGKSAAGSTSAQFGTETPEEPLLEVIVDPGQSDLGELTTDKTSSKTMTVRIRNYLSGGYTLQIVGGAPKYGNHTLATPSSPTASKPGTEQFAINAAANTAPNIGAAPLQVPSNQTSFGKVEDNYKTPNLFKYLSGEVVGRSLTESGRTDYTISMIVNVSNSTPAGHYSGDFSAVVIPVY